MIGRVERLGKGAGWRQGAPRLVLVLMVCRIGAKDVTASAPACTAHNPAVHCLAKARAPQAHARLCSHTLWQVDDLTSVGTRLAQ